MSARNWITRRRALSAVIMVLALGAILLVVHYAHWDVVAKYPVDGVVTGCQPKGFVFKTMELELTTDGTGKMVRMTLAPEGKEVAELTRGAGPGSHVRVYYERRAIWVPWEGSTRRAVGVDWLSRDEGARAVFGDGRPDAVVPESLSREQTR